MSLDLTTAGKGLLLRALAGEVKINFTNIQLGNGSDAGKNAVSLSNPLLTLGISGYEVSDIFLTLTAVYNNSEVEASFNATETGVLADDPDNPGGQILYAYEYTSEGAADRIRAGADRIVETQLDVMVYIGDAENVTASISQSAVYTPKSEFDNFVARRDNPHEVTAEQIGLGAVPNVTPENQQPEFSESIIPFSVDEKGVVSFSNIKNKENMGSILTKVRSAIYAIVLHLNGKNPHRISALDIDAAEKEHTHSATDITNGSLGLARGGTGGSTASEARTNLGIQAGVGWNDCSAGKEIIAGPIRFATPFSYVPKVVVTHQSSAGDPLDVRISVSRIEKDGFYVRVLSETTSQKVTYNWIAIQ